MIVGESFVQDQPNLRPIPSRRQFVGATTRVIVVQVLRPLCATSSLSLLHTAATTIFLLHFGLLDVSISNLASLETWGTPDF